MNWSTLYITGRPGFKEKVLESLEGINLPIMPGSTGSEQEVLLFWIDDAIPLRTYKKKIGGKLIFKYRLQFFCTEEAWLELLKKDEVILNNDEAPVRPIPTWHRSQDYLHSA